MFYALPIVIVAHQIYHDMLITTVHLTQMNVSKAFLKTGWTSYKSVHMYAWLPRILPRKSFCLCVHLEGY